MLSKSTALAITALTLILFTSCRPALPWAHEQPSNEVNLAFRIQNNLLFLLTTTVNRQAGRVFFGSAAPRSVIDPSYAARLGSATAAAAPATYELHLNQRATLPFTPVVLSLKGVGDALIGSDVFSANAVTIDYRTGLLTYQKDGIHADYMTVFGFETAPAVVAQIDGRNTTVIVDTALPDTIVLPRGGAATGRRVARVVIAGTEFGNVDLALGDVAAPRIGNRLLSKFLVSIDYRRRQVGLWRDPRIGM